MNPAPEPRPAGTALLIAASIVWFVLPYVCTFVLIGFTPATWALSQGIAMAGSSLLALVLAWLAPRYLLVPAASMVAAIAIGWTFGWRDTYWPGRLLVDRGEPWLLATVVIWTGILAVAAWLSREQWAGSSRTMFRTQRARDRVASTRGRLRRKLAPYRTGLNRIGTGLACVVSVIVTAGALWLTTVNIGYAVADEPGTLRATIDGMSQYQTNKYGGRSTSWYLTTESGREIHLRQDDAIARDRHEFGTSPGKGGLYRGCYFQETPQVGDSVTLTGRHGLYGFAVDRVLAVSHHGAPLCDGDRERARRAELERLELAGQ